MNLDETVDEVNQSLTDSLEMLYEWSKDERFAELITTLELAVDQLNETSEWQSEDDGNVDD